MSLTPQPVYHHIAFAADRNFSVPLGLACLSLMRAAREGSRYHIHILGDRVEESILDELQQLCEEVSFKLSYHDVGDTLRGVAETSYFPSVAFGRFLLPDILPEDVDKAIYLDADVMICEDLAALYTMDMGDSLLAAVPELAPIASEAIAVERERWARQFGHDATTALYCNSGVLLFNLPQWRLRTHSKQILQEALRAGSKYLYPDQDLMNGLWQRRIIPLDQRYCTIPHQYPLYTTRRDEVLEHVYGQHITAQQLRDAAQAPAIMHFVSSSKPFVLFPPSGGNAPFYSLWKSSPWRHRLPYTPHRVLHGIRVTNSASMKLLACLLKLPTYIPCLYPLWWKLAHYAPLSWKRAAARFFQWTMPEN